MSPILWGNNYFDPCAGFTNFPSSCVGFTDYKGSLGTMPQPLCVHDYKISFIPKRHTPCLLSSSLSVSQTPSLSPKTAGMNWLILLPPPSLPLQAGTWCHVTWNAGVSRSCFSAGHLWYLFYGQQQQGIISSPFFVSFFLSWFSNLLIILQKCW